MPELGEARGGSAERRCVEPVREAEPCGGSCKGVGQRGMHHGFARHTSELDQQAWTRVELGDARPEHVVQAQRSLGGALGLSCLAQELAEKQRVSTGFAGESRALCGRATFAAAEQLVRERFGVGGGERTYREFDHRSGQFELRQGGERTLKQREQNAGRVGRPHQGREQRQAVDVRPLHVVDDDQRERARANPCEDPLQAGKRSLAFGMRLERDLAGRFAQACDERLQHRERTRHGRTSTGKERTRFRLRERGQVAREPLDHPVERLVG